VSFREYVAGELIDIIEWMDDSGDTMAVRFDRPHNEIKNGAQLIVRPGQLAVFVNQGRIADVFHPGRHTLTTGNLPVLSRLMGWKYGFESPFKAEVIFVSSKQFANRKWGTSNPVIVRDADLGAVRLRAFGLFSVRVAEAATFVAQLVSTDSVFRIGEIDDSLRNLVVSNVSAALGSGKLPVMELARSYPDLGRVVQGLVAPAFAQYGLELTQIVIENVSVPPEVEAAIDQQAKIAALGNLDKYAKLQSADALRDAAKNPGGLAASGVGLGLGVGMAQQAMQSVVKPALPPAAADEPPPIPQNNWYYVEKGERRGPVSISSLQQQLAGGTLTTDTLVWQHGMPEWAAISTVPGITKAAST
jgi:membrane protease subunit (stomatin/prohibitin family)